MGGVVSEGWVLDLDCGKWVESEGWGGWYLKGGMVCELWG